MESQQYRFLHPDRLLQQDLKTIYTDNELEVGWPMGVNKIFEHLARPHTGLIIGAALGDEGKGRFVDNTVEQLLKIKEIKKVVVIRFQGGNNSGHTVQVGEQKLALHQVPSGVMYAKTLCVIDRGMVVNPIDLLSEIHIVEDIVGDTRKKLILSPDAVLNTDLERAEELLNRKKQDKAGGGTGRGISPSYAHHYDKLGFHVTDLTAHDWREKLGKQYDVYEKEFGLFGIQLSQVDVPDFAETKRTGNEMKRNVGNKEEFLDRLEIARTDIIDRDMIRNTFILHQDLFQDLSRGVLFEGAQAVGLHAWLGTLPDVTASDTSAFGIQAGTGFWKAQDVDQRIGVFKIPYTSSVGARHMPTEAHDAWADKVRDVAHEYGTTTNRPRDILYLDIPMHAYNIHMGGIEMLAGTHLDISWPDMPIKVCTHYTDGSGNTVPYQPGLIYQRGVVPNYIELPGWDGEAVQKAKKFDDIPDNAKKFLAFLQKRLIPIIAVTTGPKREHFLTIPQYD